MKFRLLYIGLLVFSLCAFFNTKATAQCSMCTLNAESSVKNGQTEGGSLNDGILYLLAAPYLAVAGVGLLWYKKYRKKNANIQMPDKPFNAN